MSFILKEFLSIKNCKFDYRGPSEKLQEPLAGVSIDSRTILPGEVYFALKGETHDGHAFLAQAFDKQAKAAIVEQSWWRENESLFKNQAVFVVADSLKALQESASAYRAKFNIPIIALTGTNGKTTTKEMIAAVLNDTGKISKTAGNLNNHIGVPLTLFKINGDEKALVLEMGMNHVGEIARLCEIAGPNCGLITNIGCGHLEFLKTLEGVAKAKMELFDYLAPNRTAFINLDDPLIVKHAPDFERRITYGVDEKASVTGKLKTTDELGHPILEINNIEIKINAIGAHNVSNALAAIAVGKEYGVSLKKTKLALENLTLPDKRMQLIKHKNMVIINDAYNANPDSTLAALATLKALPASGKKIFIFADMLELGEQADLEHAKIGESLSNYGVDAFFAHGPLAAEAVKAVQKGNKSLAAEHFSAKEDLILALKASTKGNETILVKGSRGMKMEEIVEGLLKFM